jgi:hypothetical protein
MHIAIILRVKFPDGKIDHYAWMVDQGTRKQAEKYIADSFAKENVYGPLPAAGRPLATLEEMIYVGETESHDYDDTTALSDKAEKRASTLTAKAMGPKSKGADEVEVEKPVEKGAA